MEEEKRGAGDGRGRTSNVRADVRSSDDSQHVFDHKYNCGHHVNHQSVCECERNEGVRKGIAGGKRWNIHNRR